MRCQMKNRHWYLPNPIFVLTLFVKKESAEAGKSSFISRGHSQKVANGKAGKNNEAIPVRYLDLKPSITISA